MPRIKPLPAEQTSNEVRVAYDKHVRDYHGRITNMKATLGHSLIAFEAYMQWYPLYEEVKKILGDRMASIFAWSLSEASECPLCSTYFRKIIIQSGEKPEDLKLSSLDQDIIDFGAAIARNKGFVEDKLYHSVKSRFSDQGIVILTAFAGIMIATNIFNNVLQTEIDEYLDEFKKPGMSAHSIRV